MNTRNGELKKTNQIEKKYMNIITMVQIIVLKNKKKSYNIFKDNCAIRSVIFSCSSQPWLRKPTSETKGGNFMENKGVSLYHLFIRFFRPDYQSALTSFIAVPLWDVSSGGLRNNGWPYPYTTQGNKAMGNTGPEFPHFRPYCHTWAISKG